MFRGEGTQMNKNKAIKEVIYDNLKMSIVEDVQMEYYEQELEKLPDGESKSSILRKLSELEQISLQRKEHQKILKKMLKGGEVV